MSNLHYLSTQSIRVRTIFDFSLCAISLLVALVTYFARDTQNTVGRQVYQKVEDVLCYH